MLNNYDKIATNISYLYLGLSFHILFLQKNNSIYMKSIIWVFSFNFLIQLNFLLSLLYDASITFNFDVIGVDEYVWIW